MSTITPKIWTPFGEFQVQYEISFDEEISKKIVLNNNWALDLKPIGSIIFINTNQPGVEAPNPNVWQYCDGSEITHPSSPLRSIGLARRFVPDLRKKFPRVGNNFNINATGGSWEHRLSHAHSTGTQNVYGGGLDKKGARQAERQHKHGSYGALEGDSGTPKILETPAYFIVNAYMKIN